MGGRCVESVVSQQGLCSCQGLYSLMTSLGFWVSTCRLKTFSESDGSLASCHFCQKPKWERFRTLGFELRLADHVEVHTIM